MRKYGDLNMKSVPLTADSLARYDCVLLSTNHSAYDYQFIADHARLIVDTRNGMQNVVGPREHIVTA
jgi:UDP-N-acetyl-D-glucosamine dehydrogenase